MNNNIEYKELYTNFPSGYFCSLPNGTIVDSNNRFLALTSYTREEVLGKKKVADFLSLGSKIYFENVYSPALKLRGSLEEINFILINIGMT